MPNLHTIQITPKAQRKLGSQHQALCAERGVKIVTGYHNPNLAWKVVTNRSPHYRQQRNFLLGLMGEQKALFDELLQLGFHSANLVARYFCLHNEEFQPQHEVALEVDFPVLWDHAVSGHINSVFCYLDPTFKAAKLSAQLAHAMRNRVIRLRTVFTETVDRVAIARRLNIEQLPTGLPLSRLYVFEAVLQASRSSTFARLREHNSRQHQILTLRYGLEDSTYRTLEEIGQVLGVTRERVRQIEEVAFDWLGIQEDLH